MDAGSFKLGGLFDAGGNHSVYDAALPTSVHMDEERLASTARRCLAVVYREEQQRRSWHTSWASLSSSPMDMLRGTPDQGAHTFCRVWDLFLQPGSLQALSLYYEGSMR